MKISVIVPCYNEASRGVGTKHSLLHRLEEIHKFTSFLDVDVIFVDDGSTDGTFDLIFEYIENHRGICWSITRHTINKGKGAAIITGIRCAEGDYIAIMDADLSCSPKYLVDVIDKLSYDTCYIASRYLPESKITNKRSVSRRFVSKCARQMLTRLFGLSVSDTQCGFKVFPANILKLYKDVFIDSKWLFAMKENGISFKEFPVVWRNMERESTLRLTKALFGVLNDLILIWINRRKFHSNTIYKN